MAHLSTIFHAADTSRGSDGFRSSYRLGIVNCNSNWTNFNAFANAALLDSGYRELGATKYQIEWGCWINVESESQSFSSVTGFMVYTTTSGNLDSIVGWEDLLYYGIENNIAVVGYGITKDRNDHQSVVYQTGAYWDGGPGKDGHTSRILNVGMTCSSVTNVDAVHTWVQNFINDYYGLSVSKPTISGSYLAANGMEYKYRTTFKSIEMSLTSNVVNYVTETQKQGLKRDSQRAAWIKFSKFIRLIHKIYMKGCILIWMIMKPYSNLIMIKFQNMI